MSRKLYLDLCDYSRKVLYPLYDNDNHVPGEATNVIVQTERNGWRQLSFTLPAVCHTDHGDEDNAALQYLKSDYMIRLMDDYETDWFILSGPKIVHNGFQKSVQVTAGHISQLLKVKNLGLEFSDEYGNNVGTAEELAETILEGTGWTLGYVHPFYEKRLDENGQKRIKKRTLKASAKTGAFKLMTTMCDLFEAKPIYHGDTKTVDILPINPFADYEPGTIPDLSLANGVIELHYGKNIKNVTRSLNSENIVTRLYAYGSFGDKTSGYCAIDECEHTEYTITLTRSLTNGQRYWFAVDDDAGVSIRYTFTAQNALAGDKLIFSLMDPASMMYLWNDDKQLAYPLTKGQDTDATALFISNESYDYAGEPEKQQVRNWFSFLMDFDYYRQAGMFSDAMIQTLAEYQRGAVSSYEATRDAAEALTNMQTELARVAGSLTLCKIDVKSVAAGTGDDAGYTRITLNKDTYADGIIYRSDYDNNTLKQWKWVAADTLDQKGDPLNKGASILYVIRDTDPATGQPLDVCSYKTAFLRRIDDPDDVSEFTVWLSSDEIGEIDLRYDHFFVLKHAPNGALGSLEGDDESIRKGKSVSEDITDYHPVYYIDASQSVSSVDTSDIAGYGWLWRYHYVYQQGEILHQEPELYFCYASEGDDGWKKVFYTNEDPVNPAEG